MQGAEIDPQAMSSLLPAWPAFWKIFYAHQLIWGDCQQLLATLFIAKEQDGIPLESRKLARGLGILPDAEARIEWTFLSAQPSWDPNTKKVRGRWTFLVHQTLLGG